MVFPDLEATRIRRVQRSPYKGRTLSKRKARRREYGRMQALWRQNMSKAAGKMLDGDADGMPHPDLVEQINYWRPILEERSVGIRSERRPLVGNIPTLDEVWPPITVKDVTTVKLPAASAPGLDGLTVKRWMTQIPVILRAAILNIIMAIGYMPKKFRDLRTVFISRKREI